MSAWGRLGLIQAAIADAEEKKQLDNHKSQEADKNSSIEAVAEVLGYETKKISTDNKPKEPNNNAKTAKKLETTVEQPEPSNGKVPPAQFVVVKSKTVYHQETDKPKELSGPTLTDWNNNKTAEQKEKDKNATLYFGLPSALMPSARYLPLLQNVLGKLNKTHKIDTKTVIRKTAAGKFLTQLPKQHLQQWPKNLLVVVDNSRALEPYWYDFELIIAALKKLLGNNVTSIAFDKDSIRSNHTPWCRYSNWPGRGEDFKFHYFSEHNPLARADAILLLSDLGALKPYASHHLSDFISAKISPTQRKSKQFLTLSPVDLTRKSASFLNPVVMVDTVKLPRFPKSTHNPPNKKLNQEVKTLLAAVAYLPVFDAALLRKLRTELNLGGSYLDGVIWNHEHISGNQVGKLIDAEHQDDYRAVFKRFFSQVQQDKIWRVVEKHFSNAVEGLNQLVGLQKFQSDKTKYREKSEAAQSAVKYFAALAASHENRDKTSSSVLLKAQCKTAFATLSENVDDKTYQLLAAAAYKEEIQNGRWPEELPLALKPKLSYLNPNDNWQEQEAWMLASTSKQGIIEVKPFIDSDQVLEVFTKEKNTPVQIKIVNQANDAFVNQLTVSQASEITVPKNCKAILETGLEKVIVESIHRPNWAAKLSVQRHSNKKLAATVIPHYFGEEYKIVHRTPKPFDDKETPVVEDVIINSNWISVIKGLNVGEDQYGTYLDLNLFGINQRFRWINPGTFPMGSPESEKGRADNETQHQVTLTQGFWLADTTCTQALWQAVMGNNPSRFKGENKPVENISWLDAQAFIKKLTQQYSGIGFRLPTEAEWEYACRAGTLTPFSFGEELTLKQANYRGTWKYEDDLDKNSIQETCGVTDFPPNPWGLYQMHGNVREWCNDWYQQNVNGDYTDPEGPLEEALTDEDKFQGDALRVVRGGSWSGNGRSLRSACRIRLHPDDRLDFQGLRLSLGHELQGGGADSERSEPNSRGRDSRENFFQKTLNRLKRKP